MTTFVVLYRGKTVSDAKMVAVSGDPALVAHVATAMLNDPACEANNINADPVIGAVQGGRRRALELVKGGQADE